MSDTLPVVAIVGRPNVGKSTFFNKIAGRRLSIVKDEIGVTRDRLYTDAEWCGYNFLMIDTGGIDIRSDDDMYKHMLAQANLAIEVADVVVFMTDGKSGITKEDMDIAKLLKRSNKRIILAVNKIDNNVLSGNQYEFYKLGLGEPLAISSEQMLGLGDLLDEIVKGWDKRDTPSREAIKIAVVGKPNAGKSSIVNRLLGYDRVIVSDVAGTTRDAVDTPFVRDGKEYVIIDTAGIRRKRAIESESVESYGVMRAIVAIKRADIVLIVLDAAEDISEQDVRIAGLVHEENKPSIVVFNKWDLVDKDTHTVDKYRQRLEADLAFMSYFVLEFVSAIKGTRIDKLIDTVDRVMSNASRRIQTSVLNDIIGQAYSTNPPVAPRGQRVKIFYATQVEAMPPKFIVFCNNATLVHNTYRRYLENCIRKAVELDGTPIRMLFNNSKEDGK